MIYIISRKRWEQDDQDRLKIFLMANRGLSQLVTVEESIPMVPGFWEAQNRRADQLTPRSLTS